MLPKQGDVQILGQLNLIFREATVLPTRWFTPVLVYEHDGFVEVTK